MSKSDETRSEILATVNEAMQTLQEGATVEQLDVVLLAAGFNPKAVRSFARVLLKQESAATGKPPASLDAGVKWARRYLDAAVDDLFNAGGNYQAVMVAAQSLPTYVAQKARAEHERKRRPTPGNGVQGSSDEG